MIMLIFFAISQAFGLVKLKNFQGQYVNYWENRWVFNIIFAVLFLGIMAFSFTCSTGSYCNAAICTVYKNSLNSDDIENVISIFGIITTFFGFGTAFIGSQSIQYSVIKILVRYNFLWLFLLNFFLVILSPFLSNSPTLIALQLLTSGFLLFHTIFLIDKFFDPEELILEVVVPMIFNYENYRIRYYGTKQYKSNLYKILKEGPPSMLPNAIIPLAEQCNTELATFSKCISRLLNNGSIRVSYLLELMMNENYMNSYCFSHFSVTDNLKKDMKISYFLMSFVGWVVWQKNKSQDDLISYIIIVTEHIMEVGYLGEKVDKRVKLNSANLINLIFSLSTENQNIYLDFLISRLNREECLIPDDLISDLTELLEKFLLILESPKEAVQIMESIIYTFSICLKCNYLLANSSKTISSEFKSRIDFILAATTVHFVKSLSNRNLLLDNNSRQYVQEFLQFVFTEEPSSTLLNIINSSVFRSYYKEHIDELLEIKKHRLNMIMLKINNNDIFRSIEEFLDHIHPMSS